MEEKPSQKQVTKAVRNIVSNEMGVTRTDVQTELKEMLRERIDTAFRSMDLDAVVREATVSVLNNLIRKNSWDRSALQSAVIEQVKATVSQNLKLSVECKVGPQ
ncbi:hypothetical protein FDI24_gp163 [Acidovorax phage ACP17]|uniref:Uncharacterized protein n=1 Tax=Acidovorax phage ACP17 TaxID=2010329 RepID=A0A218M326_9CAUD|nr:hypothetical protein FDI24_gp163 [Acidovorax phage ACP17]ASD50445.1 hypothetical protein [Acidovorax phage ACP17]